MSSSSVPGLPAYRLPPADADGQEAANAGGACWRRLDGDRISFRRRARPQGFNELFPTGRTAVRRSTRLFPKIDVHVERRPQRGHFPVFVPPSMQQPEQLHHQHGQPLPLAGGAGGVDGVNLFPGFPAAELIMEQSQSGRCDHRGRGRAADGSEKDSRNLEWSCAQSMCCLASAAGGI